MPKRRVSVSSDADFSAVSASASESDYDDVRRPAGKAAARKHTANSAPRARKARKVLAPLEDPITSGSTTLQISNCEGKHVFASDSSETIAGSLLGWFDGVYASRGMPWRKKFNPAWNADERGQRAYEVWISEIMLQQTQVATVIPYYNKWMQKFPTLQALVRDPLASIFRAYPATQAKGSIDEVHALWKGLGYYSRASRLLEGAQKVVNTPKLQGRLPGNAEAMQAEVPGVGRYSAGAICSIAYGEQVPVLDGNVNRLLSRVLGLYSNPKAKATLDILWAGATALVMAAAARQTPGDLNQALIELGSTVCKPKGPACNSCPIKTHCRAFRMQSAAARPSVLDMMRSSSTRSTVQPTATGPTVGDIEELCGLCAPLPYPPNVEAFPMRAEKKKAREEIDIVRVVEWRSGTAADQRWFLLVKRPDGGLLGGLEEFPTDPVVEESVQPTDPDGARTALENLLADGVGDATAPRRNPNKASTDQQRDSQPSGRLRLVHIKEAGSVLHVFSHIRKTYRVAWVVLEGGQGPPKLLSNQVIPQAQQPPKKSAKVPRVTKRRRGAQTPAPDEVIDVDEEDSKSITGEQVDRLRWIPLHQVRAANIGTGVVKIWDRVRTEWEDA